MWLSRWYQAVALLISEPMPSRGRAAWVWRRLDQQVFALLSATHQANLATVVWGQDDVARDWIVANGTSDAQSDSKGRRTACYGRWRYFSVCASCLFSEWYSSWYISYSLQPWVATPLNHQKTDLLKSFSPLPAPHGDARPSDLALCPGGHRPGRLRPRPAGTSSTAAPTTVRPAIASFWRARAPRAGADSASRPLASRPQICLTLAGAAWRRGRPPPLCPRAPPPPPLPCPPPAAPPRADCRVFPIDHYSPTGSVRRLRHKERVSDVHQPCSLLCCTAREQQLRCGYCRVQG